MRWVAAALTVLALAACGVPIDDGPRAIRPSAARSADPGSAPSAQAGTGTEEVCLLRDGLLTPVPRRVRTPISADAHLRLLLDGPTPVEQAGGYTSALSGVQLVTRARQDGGLVSVEAGDPNPEAGRTDDVLAYGQVVCTLASRLPVGTVVFEHNGTRLRIPRADGSLSDGPLTIADYAGLLAPE